MLVLGGTTEGRVLWERLVADARFEGLLSFAGRTMNPRLPAAGYRVGGFGGPEGLAAFLEREHFDALVDATHPFAAQMSRNAVDAAGRAGTPLIRLERPAWAPQPFDDWRPVSGMREAALAIGAAARRVFLSVGRTDIDAFRAAPQHDYLIRAVDPFEPALPCARVIAARGPFALADELALLSREAIEVIVSKNSGTAATYAKLEAARALALPVIMVERPQLPAATTARTLDEILDWLSSLHAGPRTRRGA